MIFPNKMIIKLMDEQGDLLRIGGIPAWLLTYHSKDEFWRHHSSFGTRLGSTNDKGVFETSRRGFEEKWDEARRMYPMDFSIPYEKYQDYISITLGGGWKKGERCKAESHELISIKNAKSGSNLKELIENALVRTCYDYSLVGITPDQELTVEIPVVGFNFPPPNEEALRAIKTSGDETPLREAFEKNARKGAHIEIFGQPFEKPMNSPFFLNRIDHTQEGLLLDFSDEHEGLVRIELRGLKSYRSLSSEITIFSDEVQLDWAFAPERFWKGGGVKRWVLKREESAEKAHIVHATRFDPRSHESHGEEIKTNAPALRLRFYATWPWDSAKRQYKQG
jgi:hypothetical protein